MAEHYDDYDYSYRNQKKDDLFDMPVNDRDDRAFSSMAEFNDRFADLFKGRENSYNLNGDIYYKGRKVYNASEYVPDTKKETINKKGRVKSKSKKSGGGAAFAFFIIFFVSIFMGFAEDIDSESIEEFGNFVKYIISEFEGDRDYSNIANDGGNTVTQTASTETTSTETAADYDAIKASLNMPATKPVENAGEINVCGTKVAIGMTAEEIIDLGYLYDENWSEETGGLKEIDIKYSMDDDSFDMLYCHFILRDDGDINNYADYMLDSFYTGYWNVYDQQIQIYYNAEIIYGIQVDMPFEEAKNIISEKDVEQLNILDEGDYPSITFVADNVFYFIMADHGKISQMSLEEIR